MRLKKIGRGLLAVLLAGMFLYAAVCLSGYWINAIRTSRANEALQAIHDQAAEETEEPLPSPTPSPVPTRTPVPTPRPTNVPAATLVPAPTASPVPELLETYQYIGEEILPELLEMQEINQDTVAWIEIPNLISLPVVYRDNEYYLDHDFYGRKNRSGTLFLDELHAFEDDTQYLVVHGHNMTDGSMFAMLTHYRDKNYIKKHPYVYLTTLYREEKYEILGVLNAATSPADEGYVAFTGNRKFSSLAQFQSFSDSIRQNAINWKADAQILPTDALLALSTCYQGNRIVLMCRRVFPEGM